MRQPREDAALAREALAAAARGKADVEELDGNMALVAAIGAARQPHAAHAALAELALDDVGADAPAGEPALHAGLGLTQKRRAFEEVFLLQARQAAKQLREVVGQRGVFGAQRRHALDAHRSLEIEQLVEQRAQARPLGLVDGPHSAKCGMV